MATVFGYIGDTPIGNSRVTLATALVILATALRYFWYESRYSIDKAKLAHHMETVSKQVSNEPFASVGPS
jgi:hypothetical protein